MSSAAGEGYLSSGDTNLVIVRSPREVRQLTSELRASSRTQPVICMDTGRSGMAPMVPPARLREMLDPRVRIYVIANPAMQARLTQRLGEQFMPTHGIRIFWPGLQENSDPCEHPLVPVRDDENATLEAFALALDRSRPTLHSLHVQLKATAKQLADVQQELERTRRALSDAKKTTAAAETRRKKTDERLSAISTQGDEILGVLACMDHEESMHFLIFTQWLRALTAADRLRHPLGAYVFGARFLNTVNASRALAPADRIAYVCAMVVCGRAKHLSSLEPQPLPDIAQARKRRRNERQDGAKGWLCHVTTGPGAKRLVYWTHPHGHTEFDSVRGHDELGRA